MNDIKKFLKIILASILFLLTKNVYAAELYYQNDNGVIFAKEEYDFLSRFYFEGYQDYMTLEDYNNFISSNIMNGKIQIVESDNSSEYIMPLLDVVHNTNKKSLKLSSSCFGAGCNMAITLSWTQDSATRSYDLIGAYVENTQITNRSSSYLAYNNGIIIYPVEQRTQYNAISSTYKLPSTGSAIRVVENFTVNNSGKVTASYQHATQNITLANSSNYTFSSTGAGGVFLFNASVTNYYDHMLGVYLILG